MIFTIIISNKSTIIKHNYYSETQTAKHMKLKPMMFINTFGVIKKNLISVIIQKIANSMIKLITKIIGKFIDETSSIPITEFIGLRSKMYSYIKNNDQNNKTAKGIKKIVIQKNIKQEDYKQTLFNKLHE